MISCSLSVSCCSARSAGAGLGSGLRLHPQSLELGLADSVGSPRPVGGFLARLLEVLGEAPRSPDPTAHLTEKNGGGGGSRSCAPDHPATLPYGHTSWTHMTRVITEPMTFQQERSLCPRLSSASRTYSVWTPSQQTTAQRPQTDTEGQCQCGRTPSTRPCMWDTERNGGGDGSPSPARTVLQFIWLLSSRGSPDVSIPALLCFAFPFWLF